MATELHVGNVSAETTESELRTLFSQHGLVVEITLKAKRSAKGSFAFVTMSTLEFAEAAIEALNGTVLTGRFITVNKAGAGEDCMANPSIGSRRPHRSVRRLY